MSATREPTPSIDSLLDRAANGDVSSIGELFDRHRDRLRRMIQFRLDDRINARVDPSDVLQDVFIEYARALPTYVRSPECPFFLWLRFLTGMKLNAVHRHHLGVRARDPRREVSLAGGPATSSVSLASHLLGDCSTPSESAQRAEHQARVQDALNAMDPVDREVLSLRHFEQLTNQETAAALGLSEAAASNRFVRALRRLKEILPKDDD